ncbi:hypothetical protein F7D13_07265 [Methylocystis rosea]|uniref:Uncharacterized protein n=1 Tax=Methylocystis rosea TaxID=173366 RepID=A0ABX6EGN6_9HYPH|nr:hypothetical protein [Methylocystis rosea]QGM93839.1 hypothetical protein F7D13_07265 [Methylocystis rosea]
MIPDLTFAAGVISDSLRSSLTMACAEVVHELDKRLRLRILFDADDFPLAVATLHNGTRIAVLLRALLSGQGRRPVAEKVSPDSVALEHSRAQEQ